MASLPGIDKAVTSEGLEKMRLELAELETNGRRDVAKRIEQAIDFGDLKENSEYHDAKEEQGRLEARINLLRNRVESSQIVSGRQSGDVAGFSSTVTFKDEASGKAQTFTLVSTAESDPSAGRISVISPVGSALLGSKVGQVVEAVSPSGRRRLKISKID